MDARSEISEAVFMALKGIQVQGLNVFRHVAELPENPYPYLLQLDGLQTFSEEHGVQPERLLFLIEVQIGVAPMWPADLGLALNALYTEVIQTLIRDDPLKPICGLTEVDFGEVFRGDDEGHGHNAVQSISFQADYQRASGDPAVLIPVK